MVDADGTYPLDLIGSFLSKLRAGADMVIGNRFGGTIHAGAMPWANRYIGNPILTGMLNLLFGSGVADAHCGLRAVRRDVVPALKLSATGMEFASEMVIKAGKRRLRIEEIPIDYRRRIAVRRHPRPPLGAARLDADGDRRARRVRGVLPEHSRTERARRASTPTRGCALSMRGRRVWT